MSKRKKRVLFFVALTLIVILAGYFSVRNIDVPSGKYTSVTIRNGTTEEAVTIMDSNAVSDFTDKFNSSCGNLNGVRFIRMGYSYSISFNDGNNEKVLIMRNGTEIESGSVIQLAYGLDKDFSVWIETLFTKQM